MKHLRHVPAVLTVVLALALHALAGSIPEELLHDDSARVYFGRVTAASGEGVTVEEEIHIKGDFLQGRAQTFSDFIFTAAPAKGQLYLCGVLGENNPLCIWEVSSHDPATLELPNTDGLSRRMQQYLNSGAFAREEAARERRLRAEDASASHRLSGSPAVFWIVLAALAAVCTVVIVRRGRT